MTRFDSHAMPPSKAFSPSEISEIPKSDLIKICFQLWILTSPFFFFPSLFISLIFVCACHYKPFPDCLCRLRRPAPLLLPGSVHVDVPGGRAALHHAGGGVWERALAPTLLLPGGLRSPRTNCGRFRRRGLPQLWHRPNVSTCGASLWVHWASRSSWMLQKNWLSFLQVRLKR